MLFIFFQIIVIWSVVIWVSYVAVRRDRRFPLDDLGVLLLGVFALYSTIPPLSWLFNGGSYGPFSGFLYQLQPNSNEVAHLLNITIAYISGFSTVYLMFQRRVCRFDRTSYARISFGKMIAACIIVSLVFIILFALNVFEIIRTSKSYGDSYLVIAELPLAIRQFIKIIQGFSSVAATVIVVALLQRWPHFRWLFIIYLFTILLSINPGGSRSGIVTSFLAIIISWHVLVRLIPSGRLLLGGVFGLMIFSLMGIWRASGSISNFDALMFPLFSIGEFDSIWCNAVHLLQLKQNGGINVSFTTKFNEIFAFVPSQFLWFEKNSLSNWYLESFFPVYKDQGGGLAFGAISQVIVGGGIFEALVRGVILGTIAGWLMKWFRSASRVWWKLPLQLYLLIWVFQTVRDTTFSLWGGVVQVVLPAFFVIAIIGAMIPTRKKRFQQSSDI